MSKDKQHSTEDVLKQKMEGFELPVEDFVFDAIEKELDIVPSKPKRGPWFWLTLLGLFLSVLTLILFVFNPFGNKNTNNTNITSTDIENFEIQNQDPSSLEKMNAAEDLVKQESYTIDDGNTIDEEEKQNKTAKPDEVDEKLVKASINSVEALAAEKHKTGPTNSISQELKKKTESSTKYEIAHEGVKNEVPQEVGSTTKQTATKTSNYTQARKAEVDNNATSRLEDNLKEPGVVENQIVDSDSTSIISEPEKEFGFESIAPISSFENKELSKFRVQALSGFGLSYRLLNSPENQELQQHKDNHERYGYTFSFAVNGKYHFNDIYYASLGLGYASYSERYAFHHDTIIHNTANTYNYIQVPLNLGIRVYNANRLSVYGQFGVVWNLLSDAQSSWVDPNSLSAVSHSNGGPDHPFQENTFQTTLGVDIAIKLNNNWELNLIPGANIFLNSVYLQSTNLDQKPYSGFVNIGLSRGF